MKKTKIVCTIGPSCSDVDTLKDLIAAGMNVARINFSHGTYTEHEEIINNIKTAREALNKPVAILLDTKGPEIRLGIIGEKQVDLHEGEVITLLCNEDNYIGDNRRVSVSYHELYNDINKGSIILIDDGKVKLKAENINEKEIDCKVIGGGSISSRKGVNVPGVNLAMEFLSDKDKQDIAFGIKNDIDYIAASFVRRKDDVIVLRQFLKENGGEEIKVIAKLENTEGINNYEEIITLADGIMVARGDLGVEVSYEKLPGIQKRILRKCFETGKPAITATQMLESMIENTMPTRAEITDVANAVFDGTTAVMLSGETAVGKRPVETVSAMSAILMQAEADYEEITQNQYKTFIHNKSKPDDAVAHAAVQAAEDIGAKIIIAATMSGYTANMIAKRRPGMPVVAVTPEEKTYYQMALTYGVHPMIIREKNEIDDLIAEAVAVLKKEELIKEKDNIVLCAGVPLRKRGNTNLMKIISI